MTNARQKARKAARRAPHSPAAQPNHAKGPARPRALSPAQIEDLFTAPDCAPAPPASKAQQPARAPLPSPSDSAPYPSSARQARTAAAIARRQEDGHGASAQPSSSAVRFDSSIFRDELAAVAARARAEADLRAGSVSAHFLFRQYLAPNGCGSYRPSAMWGQSPLPPQHFLSGQFNLLALRNQSNA